jgi:CubicO group peptidase (beta-lactamase class C family)
MNSKLILCALLTAITSYAYAQKKKVTTGKPATDQVNASKTLDINLDSLFSSFNQNTPGIALTVLQNGKVIAKKAYGMASLEHKAPFTHNTVVRLPYSEGREFLAIAAALMEAEGILSLNDQVRKFFPQLPDWAEQVTVRDLLNHRSGFCDEWATMLLTQNAMSNRFEKEQFLQLLYRQQKPEVTPKKGYLYSNSDFGLLRLILEKASGQNLNAYAKQKIFLPLQMTSTRYHDHFEETIPGFADQYMLLGKDKYGRWLKDKTSPGGNYYIATTVSDLEKWAMAHRDKQSIIHKAMNKLLEDSQLMPGKSKGYTIGVCDFILGKEAVRLHQGVSRKTFLAEVKSQDLSIVVLTNAIWLEPQPLMEKIIHYVLGTTDTGFENKKFARESVSYDRATLEQFTGRYYNADTVTYQSYSKDYKDWIEIIIHNDSLKVNFENEIFPFDYFSKNVFKDPDYESYFEFTPNDAVPLKVHIHHDNAVMQLVKDSRKHWSPTTKDLQSFVGNYYSAQLDAYWRFTINNENKLVLHRAAIPETVLEPDTEESFLLWMEQYPGVSSDTNVKFEKGKDGKVTHLIATHPRLMGHRFDRIN